MAVADQPDTCSICLEQLRPSEWRRALYTTECGHEFHYLCIAESCAKRGGCCPLCRACVWEPPWPKGKKKPPKPAAARVVGGGRGVVTGQDDSPPRVEEWRWVPDTNVIKGTVFGYPGAEDGAPISTSPIATACCVPRVEGAPQPSRTATIYCVTSSGSRYRLGSPLPSFLAAIESGDLEGAYLPGWIDVVLHHLETLDDPPAEAEEATARVAMVQPFDGTGSSGSEGYDSVDET